MKLEAGQFYGETSQTLNADSFSFTEKSYSLETDIPSHSHELAHFCFVLTTKTITQKEMMNLDQILH